MGYGKIASYFIVLGIGWTIASWYYGGEIKQIKLDHKTALVESVSRAVDQHNALADEDRSFMETFFEEDNKSDNFFANTTEEIKNVKAVNGCFVSPDLKRLWNKASRGDTSTNTSRTNGLHGRLYESASTFYAFNFRGNSVCKRSDGQPRFGCEGVSRLFKKTKLLSRLD